LIKFKVWAVRFFAVSLALVGVGYASDFLSTGACEQQVARWIAQDVMLGYEFYVLPARAGDSAAIFKKVGARVLTFQPTQGRLVEFPWAEVGRGNFRYPFVVVVDWGYCHGPTSGQGGHRRFFCFFGYVINLGDRGAWIT
jgi:hypothetical protein